MSFQVTVLKDGFALMADLKRDMAILATSGSDWAERTRRLGSLVPDLDIFSQALIERMNGGWRITQKGRAAVEFMEARPSRPEPAKDPPEYCSPAAPLPVLARSGRRGRRQRRRSDHVRRSANAS